MSGAPYTLRNKILYSGDDPVLDKTRKPVTLDTKLCELHYDFFVGQRKIGQSLEARTAVMLFQKHPNLTVGQLIQFLRSQPDPYHGRKALGIEGLGGVRYSRILEAFAPILQISMEDKTAITIECGDFTWRTEVGSRKLSRKGEQQVRITTPLER